MSLAAWAAEHAEGLLGGLGPRWEHTRVVAARAEEVAGRLGSPEGDLMVAAAYLHDVGYAPELATTGFHPLDGARHLRQGGWERLACLVAYHGGASEEAQLRGLGSELAEFTAEDSPVAVVLDYCDLTIGPDGHAMTTKQRLSDVEARYGRDHIVSMALRQAWPRLEKRLAEVTGCLEKRKAAGQPR